MAIEAFSYQFPLQDIKKNKPTTNQAKIIFTPRVWDYSGSIKSIKDKLLDLNLSGTKEQVTNLVQKAMKFSRQEFNSLLSDIPIKEGLNKGKKIKISLPMRQVVLDVQHNWQEQDVFQSSQNLGAGIATTLAGNLLQGRIPGIIGQVAGDIGGKIMNTAKSITGEYLIQPQRQIYSGTAPIVIQLTYNFSPKNSKEAQRIKTIINLFKFLSTTQSGPEAYKEAFPLGKNPAIWKLSFINGNPTKLLENNLELSNKKLQLKKKIFDRLMFSNVDYDAKKAESAIDKIKSFTESRSKNILPFMVLQQCTVNYGDDPNKWISFPDGFPNIIQMSLSFKSYFSVQSAQVLFGYESANDIISEDGGDR